MMSKQHSLVIWDSNERCHSNNKHKVLWCSYNINNPRVETSIPQLVEDSADELKLQYLSLVYKLGEEKINNKRIVDHLEIKSDFSYWWMTLLTEKCNFSKSPQIDNIIKLMALRSWLEDLSYSNIVLVSSNTVLAESMKLMSTGLNIKFKWQKKKKYFKKESFIRYLYKLLPQAVRALIWLFHHTVSQWPLKGIGVEEWKKTEATTTFVSYLFNLVPSSAKNGEFNSRYWTFLPKYLTDKMINTNWLHFYIKSELLPNAKDAAKQIICFNNQKDSLQVHATLFSFFSVNVLKNTINDWIFLTRKCSVLRPAIEKQSGAYWPLIKHDYLVSIKGVVAIRNLLYFHLFREAISVLPTQQNGAYLQENQGWEFGFIYAWQSAGHKKNLVGVPHSTIRYWDLRFFFDKRSYIRLKNKDLPLPDFVGVNGNIAKKLYLNGGYPKDMLHGVEALRYLHLLSVNNENIFIQRKFASKLSVLILGEYLSRDTAMQMQLLYSSIGFLEKSFDFLVKPHPCCSIYAKDYPNLKMKITMEPIFKLLDYCDVVYTGRYTSAAVDAYCMGKKVITVLDQNSLNLSPLRGFSDVSFISTAKELADALNNMENIKNVNGQGDNYFHLDKHLPRWRKLLSDGANEATVSDVVT